jgi:hypothetical protein
LRVQYWHVNLGAQACGMHPREKPQKVVCATCCLNDVSTKKNKMSTPSFVYKPFRDFSEEVPRKTLCVIGSVSGRPPLGHIRWRSQETECTDMKDSAADLACLNHRSGLWTVLSQLTGTQPSKLNRNAISVVHDSCMIPYARGGRRWLHYFHWLKLHHVAVWDRIARERVWFIGKRVWEQFVLADIICRTAHWTAC